jgi:acyl-CoA thioester hydrolase
MSRVKLYIPSEKPLFTAKINVRISDINYGGHVGNDSVLSIIHEARMQLLRAKGFDEMNAGGNSLIMADAMIAYRGEAFYGDELTVDIYANDVTNKSFDIIYHIFTFRNGIEFDVAQAKTGMVCFDYTTRKIAAMTNELKDFLTVEN